ncbi:MAG: hypothetical protein NWF05_06485 [Candidatus Bathyarchaeota archaeon]|nr:hypothetical protein [Candidatus Bathyarchaeota archaeon]
MGTNGLIKIDGYYVESVETCRRALLKYYTSQAMTRSGYLVTTAIATITLVSSRGAFPQTTIGLITFALLLSALLTAGVYILLRTLYWGCLSHLIIITKLTGYYSDSTLMANLQWKTIEKMQEAKKEKGTPAYWYKLVYFLNKHIRLSTTLFLFSILSLGLYFSLLLFRM